ncbi:hypothetical protein [Streptomyces lydicus]|uniref:hypothetical protein n=1 Tax=Streptomyces lydicus TaxID=47763 RepID=UPI001012EF24|nr:hypothetical protein [Streptomyces lydicus]MCZ1008410.1 hypothetical protein [Streptomyces lydicus]
MNKFLVGSSLVAAAGAVTAIAAAVQNSYGTCSIALFVVAAGAIGAYRISRSQDAANDRAVLHRLREAPQRSIEALSNELGLRSVAVRLSIHRLTSSGELPSNADSTE